MSLMFVIGMLPALALARPNTPQGVLQAAPYTLHIQTRCAASLHVQGVANLPQQAVMRDIPEGLAFQADHHEARLTGNACQANATVQLVAGSAIISNAVNYDTLRIDRVDGPLALRQGQGDIQVDRASALLYQGSGSGDLQLGTLHGPGLLALAGPGNVTIDNADLPSLTLSTSGPGNVIIPKGMIKDLTISLSGPGDTRFDGTARNATLRTSASGNIRVQKVQDSFHSSAHASGTIEIAQTPDHGSLSNGESH